MQMIRQDHDCVDRKRSFAPCLTKGRAQQIDVPHEPIALAIHKCCSEKISPTSNKIAAVENHANVYDERCGLSIEDPDFVSLHPGYTTETDETIGTAGTGLESQRAAALARVGPADEGAGFLIDENRVRAAEAFRIAADDLVTAASQIVFN